MEASQRFLTHIEQIPVRCLVLTTILASIFVTPGPASTNDRTCAELRRVAEWDFLYIRARPEHRSPAVGAIDALSEKPILVNGECLPKGASDRDAWCPVSYFVSENIALTGYVKKFYIALKDCD